VCEKRKEPSILSKEPYVLSKEPCILSKEPCILSKEPYILSKEPYILSKEPCILPKESTEPYILPKEPYALPKEPCILSKEPYILSKEALQTIRSVKRALYSAKRSIRINQESQKSPKNPAFCQFVRIYGCVGRCLVCAFKKPKILSEEPFIQSKEP